MIPRNLPGLMKAALGNVWDVQVEHWMFSIQARFIRGDVTVELHWSDDKGHLVHSTINGTPTPYAQCVRLIRSKETS